ncbi:MAG: hypothetical protein N3B21_10410 [Clostridia bacterium]|nr:hypothetical protein [Clostridia bacterium]
MMEGFFVSIIFLGIVIIAVALVMIAYDRKKSHDYVKQLEGNKKELLNIITDAEEMVRELNRFSDYIVTQIDAKNLEVNENLRRVEEKIKHIDLKLIEQDQQIAQKYQKTVNISPKEDVAIQNNVQSIITKEEEKALDEITNGVNVEKNKRTDNKSGDKVINLNSRYREVIQLADNGLDNTEIAKKLNMGKGEIELIIGLNR